MKKLFLFFIFICLIVFTTGCGINKNIIEAPGPSECNLPHEYSFAVETDDVWTPTFQLCWNEFIKLIGTTKVEYVDGNPIIADELNKQKFLKEDLNPDDFYISVGKQTLKHKKNIEKAIWDKFKEKSDILNNFNFPDIPDYKTNKLFIYSILLKNFPFIAQFDNLPTDYFNNIQNQKYKYFGFMKDVQFTDIDSCENKRLLDKTLIPLFYVNDDDFALKIIDKTNKEEMILYLTNSNDSFENVYKEIQEKALKNNVYTQNRIQNTTKGHKNLPVEITNYYKIPYLHINKTLNFDNELSSKTIKGKNYKNNKNDTWKISKTVQTIKFDMDNKGAKLKSEAAISTENSIMFEEKIFLDNLFYFNRPFIIFLKEKNKNKPYFAARIKDGKYLIN